MKDLVTREYRTVSAIEGPLVFVAGASEAGIGETVRLLGEDGERRGQVIAVSEDRAVIQVLDATSGMSLEGTLVRLDEQVASLGLSLDMLGRTFNGRGQPLDGLPPPLASVVRPLGGLPMNPACRDVPSHFIQTGISAIDGLNTLVRGQKLPIFSGSGLPANEIAAQILRQARAGGEDFAVVFGAMGITHREASFFRGEFETGGAAQNAVLFLNLAADPTVERLMTPRCALTMAEYLAFDHGLQVLVILTDMTSYCDVLREVASAREEIPGRRGYPGYMYTDLASLYERAGRLKGNPGSVTQLPILTMPDDDITHPIPDLTGYITEGQIVLSRELHRRGVYPPIDVLPCLSRLMRKGIGPGRTREDHPALSDQLYALYAEGRDLRRLEAIVGEAGLSPSDRQLLAFAQSFEQEFLNQGRSGRSIQETLDLGWQLLRLVPRQRLTRIAPDLLSRFYPEGVAHGEDEPDPHQDLIQLRRTLQLARSGLGLLRSKREALLAEFYRAMDRVLADRELLAQQFERAGAALQAAATLRGREAVASAALATARPVDIPLVERNLGGTRYPEAGTVRLVRQSDARGYDPLSISGFVDQAALEFERAAELVVATATTEVRLKRLGSEIQRVTRRVNALQERILPRMTAQLGHVRAVLEEREREDLFRLKRFKQL